MPKMHIDRSIVMNATAEKVYSAVSDFHTWAHWSPWLIMDHDAKVNVAEDGKFYEWEGKYVGAGEMKITNENGKNSVESDLTFLKPWKSSSKVTMIIKEEGENVRLHWIMDGSLPFFMFWMKKMMESFVGMDFDRGLTMLKDYVELGEVPATMTFKGIQNFEGGKYIGIKNQGTIEELAAKMETDFTKLMTYVMDGRQENINGNAFTIYHKWDIVNRYTEYTTCVPVKDFPNDLPSGITTGSLGASKMHVIHQKGPYRFIGNLWASQYNRMRSKDFKTDKNYHPMEVYLNSPKNTEEKELETEVWFSVKG